MDQNDSVLSMDSIGGIFWAGNLVIFSSPNLLLDLTAKDSTSVLLNNFSTSEEIIFSFFVWLICYFNGRFYGGWMGARFHSNNFKQWRLNDDKWLDSDLFPRFNFLKIENFYGYFINR